MSTLSDTRDTLLAVATRQFADKGFAATSIAAIAAELGLTKQALLHHFGSKERLYRVVLEQVADTFAAALDTGDSVHAFVGTFAEFATRHPIEMRLVLRELLDNETRAETAQIWVMRDFLLRLGQMAQTERPDLSEAQARAAAYAFVGAVNYAAVSGPTLRRIYGDAETEAMANAMPDTIREMARQIFES